MNAVSRVVDVGGVAVLVEAQRGEDASVVDALAEALPAHAAPAAVRFALVGGVAPVPAREPDLVSSGVAIWWEATGAALAYRGCVAHVQRDETVVAGGADLDTVRHFFQLAVMHMLASAGRYVLHAAGIATGDDAWVLLGTSGAGKSTTAAGAHRAGWKVLADDLVVVRAGHAGPEVAGFPRPLAVPAEVYDEGAHIAGDPRRRRRLEPTILVPGWHPVAGTISISHSAGEGSLAARSGTDALGELVRSTFLVGDRELLAAFFPTAAAMSRLPAWRLSLGHDPATRLAGVARDLARLGAAVQRDTTSPAPAS